MNNLGTQSFISELLLEFANPRADIRDLQKMIFIAEDTGFSIEESKIIAPLLLDFAKKYRDTDPLNEPAVYSAIRTGASMLTLDRVNDLIPLLESKHIINTTLVTIKMIGRIFEAQPPKRINEYKNLSEKIYDIINIYINIDNLDPNKEATIQLGVKALAAMGSNSVQGVLIDIQKKKKPWFIKYCLRNLNRLRHVWERNAQNNNEIEPLKPLKLLNESIYYLAEKTKERES